MILLPDMRKKIDKREHSILYNRTIECHRSPGLTSHCLYDEAETHAFVSDPETNLGTSWKDSYNSNNNDSIQFK